MVAGILEVYAEAMERRAASSSTRAVNARKPRARRD
jgi:hypothetical protein